MNDPNHVTKMSRMEISPKHCGDVSMATMGQDAQENKVSSTTDYSGAQSQLLSNSARMQDRSK